jgi:pantetheine-phosphate adenylyltransferase
MTIMIYTGRLDPVTPTQIDLVRRVRDIFGDVIVGVAGSRSTLLPTEERVRAVREALTDLAGVTVAEIPGLTVDFARAHDARVLVRGVRSTADFEFESEMAQINREMAPEIETVYLLTRRS